MSQLIEALVMQTVTCVPGTYRKVEGGNQLYKAVLWSSHVCFIFYVNYTYIIDLYIKCLLYQLSSSMSLGFLILLLVGFISRMGFLFLLNGEWSLAYVRQEICHRATPPALMLVL